MTREHLGALSECIKVKHLPLCLFKEYTAHMINSIFNL